MHGESNERLLVVTTETVEPKTISDSVNHPVAIIQLIDSLSIQKKKHRQAQRLLRIYRVDTQKKI